MLKRDLRIWDLRKEIERVYLEEKKAIIMFIVFEWGLNNNINHSFYYQIDLLYNNIDFKKKKHLMV